NRVPQPIFDQEERFSEGRRYDARHLARQAGHRPPLQRNRSTALPSRAAGSDRPQMHRPRDWHLTVKLRGRTTTPAERRGRTMSFGARGDTTESHGPLQRLLGGTPSPVPHRALLRGRLVNTVNSRRNSCTFWNVFATEVSTVKLYALRLTSTLVPEILRRAAVEQLAVLLDI